MVGNAINSQVPAELIFVLNVEEHSGAYQFRLASHDFACVYLCYSQSVLHRRIQDLVNAVHEYCRCQVKVGSFGAEGGEEGAKSILEREYEWMGLVNSKWRLCRLNKDFQVFLHCAPPS